MFANIRKELLMKREDSMITIREAKLEDAERLVEIYSHYVLNTAVSFEYEVPTVAEFQERMKIGRAHV